MQQRTVLIIEGDPTVRQQLKGCAGRCGLETVSAPARTHALQSLREDNPELVIIGSSLDDGGDSVELAKQIRRRNKTLPLILITRHSSEDRAIAALKAGVYDYFKLPFSDEELVESVSRAVSDSPPRLRETSSIPAPDLSRAKAMIGESLAMREVKEYLLKVAETDSTVVISGESGTGKELAAELIHRNSPRRSKPLVFVDCAALPSSLLESELFGYERGAFTGAVTSKRGKLELARGGTIMLDEIGDMRLYAQARLLRAIETKEVYRLGGMAGVDLDARFVAATNRDLEQLVDKGKFRGDLFFRLNVARMHLPPLRDRKEDIPLLLQHCIRHLNKQFGRQVEGVTEGTLTLLINYSWPGNVRELKNLLEATFINQPSRKIARKDLPTSFRRCLEKADTLPQSERNQLLCTLSATNWNKTKAAEKLRWSRSTLYRKMTKHRIARDLKPQSYQDS